MVMMIMIMMMIMMMMMIIIIIIIMIRNATLIVPSCKLRTTGTLKFDGLFLAAGDPSGHEAGF